MIGIQVINSLKFLHSKGYLHRDIKPDNIMIGKNENSHRVYIIDFGLAKKYILSDGSHIPMKEGKKLTGTARYASINTHLGLEQSRRDDLESLAYLMVFLFKTKLPWMNQQGKS